MLRKIWGWFQDPEVMLACLHSLTGDATVSIAFRWPEGATNEVTVVGPLGRDLACYPFLDLVHHLRRLGFNPQTAERYRRAVESGAVLVCVEGGQRRIVDLLTRHHARDLVC